MIQEHIYVLFKELCNQSNGDLFPSDNKMLFSHVKISCLRANKFSWYFTGVNIMKLITA